MGKVAGFLKKIKSLGKSMGNKFLKAAKWVNSNIIHPNKKLIQDIVEPYDKNGIMKKVIDTASDTLYNNTKDGEVNTDWAETIKTGVDGVVDYTQNRYSNGFDAATPLNNIIRTGTKAIRKKLGGSNW